MEFLKRILGKRKILDLISFDTFGWNQHDNSDVLRSWKKDDNTAFIGIELSRHSFLSNTRDIEKIRRIEREGVLAEKEGGIISCEKVKISNYDFFKTILKEPVQPSGVNYVGKLVLPFEKAHIMIMIQICENGMTGVRDSIVFNKWIQNNSIESDEHDFIIGWVKDPYDENYRKGRPMNLSEQVIHDQDFPDHPLSELRSKFYALEIGMQIDSKLRNRMR